MLLLTFFLLYLAFYLASFLGIFISLSYFYFKSPVTNTSLMVLTNLGLKYNKFSYFFLVFFLNLSGLPPVSFFLLKVNLLISIFNSVSFFLQVLIFLNFLLTIIFYLQVFWSINTNYLLNKAPNFKIYGSCILKQCKTGYNHTKYKNTYIIIFLSSTLFFSFLFYPDLYLIFLNLI